MEQGLAILPGILIPLAALAIPIVAIILEYYEKKNKMKVIEKAIEHGTPLDGLAIDVKKPRLPYRSGMVILAIGIGSAVLGYFLKTIALEAFNSVAGLSAILILLGIALIINDKMNYTRYFEKEEENKAAR